MSARITKETFELYTDKYGTRTVDKKKMLSSDRMNIAYITLIIAAHGLYRAFIFDFVFSIVINSERNQLNRYGTRISLKSFLYTTVRYNSIYLVSRRPLHLVGAPFQDFCRFA